MAERRQITVMFVDVVGSTEMSTRHEPEVVRDVVVRYQQVCGRAISSHGGQIANYLGDGVMACFGLPTAREDDARRAVLAGLELLDELEELAAKIRAEHGIRLAARVGIDTGLVLITDMGTPDRPDPSAIVGATPNEAARIQSVAPAGSVVISETTHDIVRGYFEVASLGKPAMKGLPADLEVFRVLGPTRAEDRLQAAGGALTPLVGRAEELQLLRAEWAALGTSGPCRTRAVVLRGEPGIGKSRIAGQLVDEVVGAGGPVFRGMCSPDRTTSPFYPVARLLELHLAMEPGDDHAARLERLERGCTAAGLPLEQAVPVLGTLLDLPTVGSYEPLELEPALVRELTFQTLVALVLATADRQRALLVFEDLQWSDESTLEWLSRLVASEPREGLLVLATSRSEFRPPWSGACSLTVDVEPLPPADHRELIRQLADLHTVPENLWDLIADRSDGNPLFTEELARSVGRRLDGGRKPGTIPATVRDLLTARLDALGQQRRLAQMAATIGREIDVRVLRSAAGLPRREVSAGLATLVRASILEELPRPEGPVTHRFVHALVRDAAYESQELLKDRRSAHLAVARALIERGHSDAAVVAQHLDAANHVEEAVPYYLLAASAAQRAAAHVEAIRLLDRALELLSTMPAGPSRDAVEVNLRTLRGFSTVSTQGYAAPAAVEDYRRALDLSERVGGDIGLFPATIGIWSYYVVHGDLRAAYEAAARLRSMCQPEIEAEVFGCMGIGRFFEGEFTDSRDLLELAVDTFDRRPPGAVVTPHWQLPSDPLVATLTHLGVLQWLFGRSDDSEAALTRARNRAEALPFPVGPFSVGYVLTYAGWLANLDGRFAEGLACQERTLELSQEYGFVFWMATCSCHAAISRAHLGEPIEAVETVTRSIAQWRALGAEAFVPCMQTHLAEIRLGLGAVDEALADVDDALRRAQRRGEQFFVAESHRVRAAILRHQAGPESGGARQALEDSRRVAAEQGAVMFEVRALTDLVELARDPADVEDLRRLVQRLPVVSRPTGSVERARAVLALSADRG
ncbi:MAG TPA: adenylate/guanylate cyclase domain-containing protein [Acidimicrobiales bacterium]|nr:adenylate/guanylate cyclase domain-containing protein [Acidimicrobiales bacterium]